MAKIFASLFIAITLFVITGCEKKEEKSSTVQPLKQEVKKEKSKKEERRDELKISSFGTENVVVDFRPIQGRKLGGLYADIVGVNGTIGATHHVNYNKQLADLWVRKLDRKKVSPATIKSAMMPVELYKQDPRKMTLKEFVVEADKQVHLVKTKLDYTSACIGYKLSPSECTTWKTLAKDVRGIDIVAYGLTELMPSAEGELNVKILDILLRNAGSNYMFTIPAVYDMMLSLGFYQFTSYAIFDDGKKLVGASRMNRYLPRDVRIPGSVISLQNSEHHRAAYLFALHNFAELAKRTSDKEFTALKKAIKQKPGDIVTYMAVSHHAPSPALRCMKRWLSKGAQGSLNSHLVGRLKPYGKKSDNNLAALEKIAL